MAQQTMRGMRLGAHSLESEVGVVHSARSTYVYRCAAGHETSVVFAAEAELPETWSCKSCSLEGALLKDGKTVVSVPAEERVGRSHWEMLLERRTREELEEILQERLAEIRARRASGDNL